MAGTNTVPTGESVGAPTCCACRRNSKLGKTRIVGGHVASGTGLLQRLQFFTRLEAYSLAGRNCDFGSSTRVAANSGFARTYVEDSKAAELNALAALEG